MGKRKQSSTTENIPIEKKLPKKSRKKDYFEKTPWNISDKIRLLEGLKQFGFFNLDKIADFIKTKNTNEVRQYLANKRALLIRNHKDKQEFDKPKKKTIIQSWYDIASYEVPSRYKSKDFSIVFAEMFSNAAKNEPHLKPRTNSDPDFAAIYQYFADMLNGSFSANLRPTDSTIVLSLLHTLGNIINRGNFNLEKEMYSGFEGTKGKGSLLSPLSFNHSCCDLNKNNSNVVRDTTIDNCTSTKDDDDDSNSVSILEDMNENKSNNLNANDISIEGESNAPNVNENEIGERKKNNENGSNSINDDSDSNMAKMQSECNSDNIQTEADSNDDDELSDNNSSEFINHSDFNTSNSTHYFWKQFQLNDPYNIKLARKLKRVLQMFNPLHVPPFLMHLEHKVLKQFENKMN